METPSRNVRTVLQLKAPILVVWVLLASPAISADGSCVAIYDSSRGTTWQTGDLCATRLSPASTFKIPHALIALETDAIQLGHFETWDGSRFPGQSAWERDHTVQSAIAHSVVWFFQRTAKRVGPEHMKGFLQRFEYGNVDTSGDSSSYWLNGTLRISPDEQLAFLRRFFMAALPVSSDNILAVQEALVQAPGTIQNARGRHRVAVSWSGTTQVLAKTGATRTAQGEGTSWLVGAVRRSGIVAHVFVSAISRRGPVDPLEASHAAFEALEGRGIL